MVRWFRHYPGLARDERLMAVALRARQPIERVVWVWCAILEAASTSADDGAFEIDVDECAWFLRVDPAAIALILQELEASGRITDGRVTAWARRQFASDRSAPRTREWRRRHAANGHAKAPVAGRGNGHVTPPRRHRDAPETEAETEAESDLFETYVSRASGDPDALQPELVVKQWNLLAARLGKPQIAKLSKERRARVRARIAQHTVDDFIAVFQKIPQSKFLLGATGWQGLSFDWITKAANFQKVLEGNYDA